MTNTTSKDSNAKFNSSPTRPFNQKFIQKKDDNDDDEGGGGAGKRRGKNETTKTLLQKIHKGSYKAQHFADFLNDKGIDHHEAGYNGSLNSEAKSQKANQSKNQFLATTATKGQASSQNNAAAKGQTSHSQFLSTKQESVANANSKAGKENNTRKSLLGQSIHGAINGNPLGGNQKTTNAGTQSTKSSTKLSPATGMGRTSH